MGTVITVMNMKGGVGKTTVAMHVGGILGRSATVDGKRRKVLLIDYDAQFNLTQCFIKPATYYALEKQHKTTLAILQDDETILNPYELQVPGSETPPPVASLVHAFYETASGSLIHVIPSTLNLMYIALGQTESRTRPIEERFRKFVDEAKTLYDVIFIDCHPAGSIFTKTALTNSDHVIIPVALERFAHRGVGLMIQFIDAKRQPGASAPVPHILFNYGAAGSMSTVENDVRLNPRFKNHCMTEVLRNFKAFRDPVDGSGFVWDSSKPWSTQAYRNLQAVARDVIRCTGL